VIGAFIPTSCCCVVTQASPEAGSELGCSGESVMMRTGRGLGRMRPSTIAAHFRISPPSLSYPMHVMANACAGPIYTSITHSDQTKRKVDALNPEIQK
jgi:hypothetical protein